MSTEVFLVVAPIYAAQKQVHRTELLGIEYLAGTARQAGFTMKIWDPTIGEGTPCGPGRFYFGPSDEEVALRLRNEQPDILAISCHYGFSAVNAYSIARIAKKVAPNCTVIMGGLFISVNLTRAMEECAEIDYSIIGEGDRTFTELLQCLNAKEDPTHIDGLIYRDGSAVPEHTIRRNPKTDYIDDLDALPLPARDLVPIDAYIWSRQIKSSGQCRNSSSARRVYISFVHHTIVLLLVCHSPSKRSEKNGSSLLENVG